MELQNGHDGREQAVPLMVEYGVTNRLELMVEPVAYAGILPTVGQRARGIGDLETTLTYLLAHERGRWPAFAVAGEVKVPTARDQLIGTGRADYAAWLITSKRIGRLDTHANVAYTVVGSPAGVQLSNTLTGAFASVYHHSPRVDFFGEMMGVTAASSAGEGSTPAPGTTVPPEVAGEELFGTLGAGRYVTSGTLLFASVTRDNTGATLFRSGVTLRF